MGQKINPTGFRTGVNQAHKATWFANYSAYSEVLKEDYKIRTFFEKKFEPIYSKAGIAKLEIHRKVNQVRAYNSCSKTESDCCGYRPK